VAPFSSAAQATLTATSFPASSAVPIAMTGETAPTKIAVSP
jgi:hypothetical protein